MIKWENQVFLPDTERKPGRGTLGSDTGKVVPRVGHRMQRPIHTGDRTRWSDGREFSRS